MSSQRSRNVQQSIKNDYMKMDRAVKNQERKINKRKQYSLKNEILKCFLSSDCFMLYHVYLRLMVMMISAVQFGANDQRSTKLL